MKPGIPFKKFYQFYFQNLCNSQFVHENIEDRLKVEKYEYTMAAQKKMATHFLYLFLLTRQIPMVHKWTLKTTGAKGRMVRSNLENRHYWNHIYHLLYTLIPTQPIVESKVIQLQLKQANLFLLNLPLTHETFKLRSKNHYIPLLPLKVSLTFSYTSVFEKLYFFKTFKFIKLPLSLSPLYHRNSQLI